MLPPLSTLSFSFSPAADAEKMENILCLTPSLSHRYNHQRGTQEEEEEEEVGKNRTGGREEITEIAEIERENGKV